MMATKHIEYLPTSQDAGGHNRSIPVRQHSLGMTDKCQHNWCKYVGGDRVRSGIKNPERLPSG